MTLLDRPGSGYERLRTSRRPPRSWNLHPRSPSPHPGAPRHHPSSRRRQYHGLRPPGPCPFPRRRTPTRRPNPRPLLRSEFHRHLLHRQDWIRRRPLGSRRRRRWPASLGLRNPRHPALCSVSGHPPRPPWPPATASTGGRGTLCRHLQTCGSSGLARRSVGVSWPRRASSADGQHPAPGTDRGRDPVRLIAAFRERTVADLTASLSSARWAQPERFEALVRVVNPK